MSAPLPSPTPRTTAQGRLRAVIAVPVADVSKEDVVLIVRFFVVLGAIVFVMGVQMWTRMEVRRVSVELDQARSAVADARMENERLLLERSTLRAPERVRTASQELGLVAPVAVVEIADTP